MGTVLLLCSHTGHLSWLVEQLHRNVDQEANLEWEKMSVKASQVLEKHLLTVTKLCLLIAKQSTVSSGKLRIYAPWADNQTYMYDDIICRMLGLGFFKLGGGGGHWQCIQRPGRNLWVGGRKEISQRLPQGVYLSFSSLGSICQDCWLWEAHLQSSWLMRDLGKGGSVSFHTVFSY